MKLLRGHVNIYGYYCGVTGLTAPGKSVFMSAFIAFSLTALAYNFIRVVNIVGVASLLKAV